MAADKLPPLGTELVEALQEVAAHVRGEIALPTSINSLLRVDLEAYCAAGATSEQAADEVLRLSAESRSGRGNRRWNRDEIHER